MTDGELHFVLWAFLVFFVVVIIDEVGFYWWRKLHPGAYWAGSFATAPPQTWIDTVDKDATAIGNGATHYVRRLA